jgi:hypothetical protein
MTIVNKLNMGTFTSASLSIDVGGR